MLIRLDDGRTIDALAVSSLDCVLTAIARIGLLDRESLIWLRSRLSERQTGMADDVDAILSALMRLCDSEMEQAVPGLQVESCSCGGKIDTLVCGSCRRY